jgi:glycosyltransferase involved in cell wall biosynthesis
MSAKAFSPGQISVVVCTRNRADLLNRCLERLGELHPAALEVLVVDQSDSQLSGLVVRDHESRIPGLRHLPTPTRGLSRARNVGIRETRGEIIAFTDDDCLPRRDWIGAVAEAFARFPEIAALTGGSLPEEDCTDPRIRAATTWHPKAPWMVRSFVDPGLVGGGFNLSLKKRWIETVGSFDPALGAGGRFRSAEDTDFIHRILCAGGVVRYDPTVVVAHLPWRDGDFQSAVEWEYGYGIAAWALKRLGCGDFFPAGVAARVLLVQARRALGGLLRQDDSAWRTGAAYVSGLGRGFASWVMAPERTVAGDEIGEAKTGA